MSLHRYLRKVIIVYISAFLIVLPVMARGYSLKSNARTGNIISQNANPDLIWSILHNTTVVGTDTTMINTSHFVLNSPYEVIGKYSPLLSQGYIFITWIHNFLTPQNFCKGLKDVGAISSSESLSKCLSEIKTKKTWQVGNTWRIKKVIDQDGVWRYKAAIVHMVTPQELFKTISNNGKVIQNGKVLDNLVKAGVYQSVDYNKLSSCSSAGISTSYCNAQTFKAGETLFFDIVSAVAKKYDTDYGFVVVEHVSTHTEKEKHHHGFKTKVTIKLFLDSYPIYYLIVPPDSPGVNVANVGFVRNGVGYIQVNPGTATGWDFSRGSIEVYEKSKSGWAGFVGIIVGVGLLAGGLLMGGGALGVITQATGIMGNIGTGLVAVGALYTATSAVETVSQGTWGIYQGGLLIPQYAKIDTSGGTAKERLLEADASHWLNNFGREMDGTSKVIGQVLGLKTYGNTNTESSNPASALSPGSIIIIKQKMDH